MLFDRISWIIFILLTENWNSKKPLCWANIKKTTEFIIRLLTHDGYCENKKPQ